MTTLELTLAINSAFRDNFRSYASLVLFKHILERPEIAKGENIQTRAEMAVLAADELITALNFVEAKHLNPQ